MKKEEELLAMRHSCEHVLTMAIMRLWPDKVKAAMGPATADGFYFDFDSDQKFSESDFIKIEKEMTKIIKEDLPIIKDEMTIKEAKEFFSRNAFKGNEYKHEWLDEIEERGEKVSVYWLGEKGKDMPGTFVDICSGPHVESSGKIGVFKLLKIAGAYWHGDEKNKMLQRIYGTAFATQKELTEYLEMLAEAEKRDHRKLGQELDLFCFSDLIGPGLPLFTPRGTIIREELTKFLNELKFVQGYQLVDIPYLAKVELYKTSGHYDKFKDDIFYVKGKSDEFVLKPMNCPHHAQIYASRPRSYKEMPFRYAEITKQYRDEQAGELHGLSRVRSISIDDTHIFLRPDQIQQEAQGAYEIIKEFYKPFGIELDVRLSVRDLEHKEKYLGEDKIWQESEQALVEFLKDVKQIYTVDEGEAAFYGPKIDFKGKDSIGREWQLATIQLDFNQPERFELEYTNETGNKVRPVMIHIAVAGSLERFMAILIEHFAGVFPVWLSPVQVQLAPVSEKHITGTEEMASEFRQAGIRIELDASDETVGNKVRKAVGKKVPYILIVGDKELSGEDLMIRIRGQEKQEQMSKKEFIDKVLAEIKNKK